MDTFSPGTDANQRSNALAQDGIGEQADAVELEQDGGMPQPRDAERVRHDASPSDRGRDAFIRIG